MTERIIYLDNAATSRFKPKTALDALNYDILHSANSGRSGHRDALEKSIIIEKCRQFLLNALGADERYSLVFTKNCTEALNLAIFGTVRGGERVLTSDNEHNSVLRPLYHLANEGKIKLTILNAKANHKLNLNEIRESAKNTDLMVFGGACNVTGATLDLESVGQIARENGAKLIVDGAQSVPYCDLNISQYGIDMLACPGHKGLHGIQGTGFLIVKNDTVLNPLLFGGTGTHSQELLPAIEIPDSFEAGTLFSGGIAALSEGAKWTYSKLKQIKNNGVRLSKKLIYNLESMSAELYTNETVCGVVSFNLGSLDSTLVADKLNDQGIAVRAGIHCAPLVHKRLGTITQGAVRASIGVDNTERDITILSNALENIIRSYR